MASIEIVFNIVGHTFMIYRDVGFDMKVHYISEAPRDAGATLEDVKLTSDPGGATVLHERTALATSSRRRSSGDVETDSVSAG